MCRNGGVCDAASLRCRCAAGWTGDYCQLSNTVFNQSLVCLNDNMCNGYNGYGTCLLSPLGPYTGQCLCALNWYGSACELYSTSYGKVCLDGTCKNGGTCLTNSVSRCLCPEGMTGDYCEIPTRGFRCNQHTDCNGYNDHGRCEFSTGHCICAANYYGLMCEIYSPSYGAACTKNSCQNGGSCATSGQCRCSAGWTGNACEISTGGFMCNNDDPDCNGYNDHGRCDRASGHCVCGKGWTGPGCQVKLP